MFRTLAAAALGLAVLPAFAPPALAQSDLAGLDLPQWDVVLVAHRGLAPGLPENTMAAFEHVIARGVGVIEIDLRGTADGEVVVMHDETVERVRSLGAEFEVLTGSPDERLMRALELVDPLLTFSPLV